MLLRRLCIGVSSSLSVFLAACGGDGGWRTLSAEELAAPPFDGARERADDARAALQQQLVARLTSAMQTGGATAAIEVCRDAAPTIAREVGEAQRLRIGRTSHRLRNQDNTAPVWAREHVAEASAAPLYRSGPDGQLGALVPILAQPQCLVCHGSEQQIDPGVRAALATSYPGDRATGFAAGDLRGWFWVEVPAAQ